MKKNKMLRTASAMLILTIITISIIGGALAKYTTEATGSDTAVVAKFGVTATVTGDLFGTIYATDDISVKGTMDNSVNGNTVDVVAPGTHNKEGMKLSVSGTPEVATKIILGRVKSATDSTKEYANSDIYLEPKKYGLMIPYGGPKVELNSGNYYTKTDNAYSKAETGTMNEGIDYYELKEVGVTAKYYPLKWQVKKTDNNLVECDTTDAVMDALFGANTSIFGKGETVYSPDTTDFAKSATVGWIWPFDNNTTPGANDDADTILGNMIAAHVALKADPNASPIDVVVIDYPSNGNVTIVQYDEDDTKVIDSTGKKVVYAKVGDETVACLTAAFNVSLKVEQVD